jgi:hypothetical protein
MNAVIRTVSSFSDTKIITNVKQTSRYTIQVGHILLEKTYKIPGDTPTDAFVFCKSQTKQSLQKKGKIGNRHSPLFSLLHSCHTWETNVIECYHNSWQYVQKDLPCPD